MSKKQKFYVVWKGRKPGVFDNWKDCQKQIEGFQNAVYKSFESQEAAKIAFLSPYQNYIGPNALPIQSGLLLGLITQPILPILPSIVVDGACSSAGGIAEYQGKDLQTNQILFHNGPFTKATNNMVEFLAIAHALVYCKENNLNLPIYSDSKIAINWIIKKKYNTAEPKILANYPLFDLADQACDWLKTNNYPNKILKWQTKLWGENPADFGRK